MPVQDDHRMSDASGAGALSGVGGDHGSLTYMVVVCLVATLGGLLFGYDTAVIAGAVGFLKVRFALDPSWVGWTASSALAGCVLGAMMAGPLSDWFGRKKVLIISAVLFLISAIGTAFPRDLTFFIIFRLIGGIGVGAASMTSPMYISEISPAHIRGRMVSLNQLAIVIGMLVVYFVNYFIAHYGASVDMLAGLDGAGESIESWNVTMGWRWMFGSEALPALMLLILLFFVPESPRWLTKQGRGDVALSVLSRIGGGRAARKELGEIKDAIAHESGSLAQLFMPGMRIVLAIGVILAVLQQVTGINVFLYYAPEIFKKIGGESTDTAMMQTIVVGAVNMLFTLVAIYTVDRSGRKPLMIIGAAGMCVCLFTLGLAAYFNAMGAWVLIFILGYIASFALSLGPVTWVVLSEIFPTRIRGRAMGIATVCLWVANLGVSYTFPIMDDNPWLVEKFHNAFPFWVYGALCVVEIFFVWRFLPETKGKSLEAIERMWGIATDRPARDDAAEKDAGVLR